MGEKFKVAAIQMTPVYLEPQATTSKMCELLEKVSEKGARLAVFPEVIISMYPNFLTATQEYRELYREAAVRVPGPETDALSTIARKNRMYVVTGLIERDPEYDDVIYNSSIVIDDEGKLIGIHRKISLVGGELTFYKKGNGKDIRVFNTKLGNIGVAMCFEHLNPLYRRALTVMGERIHCSLWVNVDNIRHVVDSSARITAIEGGTYVILAAQVTPKYDKPGRWGILRDQPPFIGGSGILDPWGRYINGPKYGKEEVIYADIDPKKSVAYRFQPLGIDARDDLLSLNIQTKPYQAYYKGLDAIMDRFLSIELEVQHLSEKIEKMTQTLKHIQE